MRLTQGDAAGLLECSVENVFTQYPAVREAAVLAVLHPELCGRRLHADTPGSLSDGISWEGD